MRPVSYIPLQPPLRLPLRIGRRPERAEPCAGSTRSPTSGPTGPCGRSRRTRPGRSGRIRFLWPIGPTVPWSPGRWSRHPAGRPDPPLCRALTSSTGCCRSTPVSPEGAPRGRRRAGHGSRTGSPTSRCRARWRGLDKVLAGIDPHVSLFVAATWASHNAGPGRNYHAACMGFQAWGDREGLSPRCPPPQKRTLPGGLTKGYRRVATHGPCRDPLPSHRSRPAEPRRPRSPLPIVHTPGSSRGRGSSWLQQGDDLIFLFPKLVSTQPNHTLERVRI